jgi:hypothetical protein
MLFRTKRVGMRPAEAPVKVVPTGSQTRTIIPGNSDVNVWRALLKCESGLNKKEPKT